MLINKMAKLQRGGGGASCAALFASPDPHPTLHVSPGEHTI